MNSRWIAIGASSLFLVATANAQPALTYSGETRWDQASGTLTFVSSGSMPDTKEGFYWNVPADVKKIVVAKDVRMTGAFRIAFREPTNPLRIEGEDRRTSVIYGTDEPAWSAEQGIGDSEKWKYGAVCVLQDATVHLSKLTSLNPRAYNVSGYASKSILHVSECDLIDDRPGDNNNSDGFIGSSGSSIRDSLVSTSDDGIKIYHDMTIANVVIRHRRNGAPIQFGWGGENDTATASIENLTIEGVDPEGRYNMAPFSWQGGTLGVRNVTIEGLKIRLAGEIYDSGQGRWEPIGLFWLKPAGCTLNLKIDGMNSDLDRYGRRATLGTIVIDGETLP